MSLLTPEELRELRRLHIQAGRRVDALLSGEYRSALRGQGMEFEEVRAYQPGDDVRHIDWNVTARTGEPFIKVFREERQLTVQLVVDVSGSSRVGSGGRDGRTTRRLQQARIAGGLAFASLRNRDQVGLLTFSDRIEQSIRPRRSPSHVWSILRAIFEGTATGRGTDLTHAFGWLHQNQRRRATLVLVSDFLDAGTWDLALATLSRRHQVYAICVSDPLDDGLPGLGLVEIEDAETGARRLIDARRLTGNQPLEDRLTRLRRAGARTIHISTDDDPFAVLQQAFSRLAARRGR